MAPKYRDTSYFLFMKVQLISSNLSLLEFYCHDVRHSFCFEYFHAINHGDETKSLIMLLGLFL